jgi:hypothetical protein
MRVHGPRLPWLGGAALHYVRDLLYFSEFSSLQVVVDDVLFYFESILGKSKMDKKNVQKRICQNTLPEIHVFAA